MTDATLLAGVLREPSRAEHLSPDHWAALIAIARAERLIGSLAFRLDGLNIPAPAADILADARASAEEDRRQALWEAEMARRALAPLGLPVVLLKGTAYVAAGLAAGVGRAIGDLDILVPRARIEEAETALLAAGWEPLKDDAYDDAYYRRWMHELPPLIHRERDRMIDLHHTILPLTARISPDAAGLIEDSLALGNGLRVLGPQDMIVHSAAHIFADGDLAGGLRNLWDIHCLTQEFGTEGLIERASHHGLQWEASRALRLAAALFEGVTPLSTADRFYLRRIAARDEWGRATRPFTRLAFYIRSHWLRMPPVMLARHLWTKAIKPKR